VRGDCWESDLVLGCSTNTNEFEGSAWEVPLKEMSLGRMVVNCKVENITFGDPVVK
jgi:hypothetical protein